MLKLRNLLIKLYKLPEYHSGPLPIYYNQGRLCKDDCSPFERKALEAAISTWITIPKGYSGVIELTFWNGCLITNSLCHTELGQGFPRKLRERVKEAAR